MTIPRYSREDMADQVRLLTAAADWPQGGPDGGQFALVSVNVLRATAAMLSEAAPRAPTHAELLAQIERTRAGGEVERG